MKCFGCRLEVIQKNALWVKCFGCRQELIEKEYPLDKIYLKGNPKQSVIWDET